MSKKYLAFKDDLTKISNSDLVIKEGSTTPLADEALGTSIYIPEIISGVETNVEYILVEKYQIPNTDETIITVLRKDLLSSPRSYGAKGDYGAFSASQLGIWLNGDYLNIFSNGIKANFCEKPVLCAKYRGTTSQESLKVFIPSLKELGVNSDDGYYDWTSYIDMIAKADGTAKAYWTRTHANSSDHHRTVSSSGEVGEGYATNTSASSIYVRPAIAIRSDAQVDGNNVLMVYGKTYSGNIESVQDGNSYYRIKDTRLPNGTNANDVLQWTNGAWTSSALSIPTEGDIASGDTGYATGGDVYTALEGKADTSDVPSVGTITSGNTGYTTGGDVYTAISIPDSVIDELSTDSPFVDVIAIGDDYLGADENNILSL